jgi:phosphoribosylglycinamide formyltransferase-1
VAQACVPVLPGDDEATLHERIKAVEHRLYPEAVRLVVSGRTSISGRCVEVDGDGESVASGAGIR